VKRNFLNNECVNIYVMWYRLFNFLLGGRDVDIIDLNYKKEWDILFKNQVIFSDYSNMLIIRKYKYKLTRSRQR